jgi:hypothetical protein
MPSRLERHFLNIFIEIASKAIYFFIALQPSSLHELHYEQQQELQ